MKYKELRGKLTKKQTASLLNIPEKTYANYENGVTEPSINTLINIANYYEVSLDYLCDRPFNNGVGYLTDKQRKIVNDIKELDDWQLEKVEAYVEAMKSAKEEVNKELIKRKF